MNKDNQGKPHPLQQSLDFSDLSDRDLLDMAVNLSFEDDQDPVFQSILGEIQQRPQVLISDLSYIFYETSLKNNITSIFWLKAFASAVEDWSETMVIQRGADIKLLGAVLAENLTAQKLKVLREAIDFSSTNPFVKELVLQLKNGSLRYGNGDGLILLLTENILSVDDCFCYYKNISPLATSVAVNGKVFEKLLGFTQGNQKNELMELAGCLACLHINADDQTSARELFIKHSSTTNFHHILDHLIKNLDRYSIEERKGFGERFPYDFEAILKLFQSSMEHVDLQNLDMMKTLVGHDAIYQHQNLFRRQSMLNSLEKFDDFFALCENKIIQDALPVKPRSKPKKM